MYTSHLFSWLRQKSFGDLTCARTSCLNEAGRRMRAKEAMAKTEHDLEVEMPTDGEITPPPGNFDRPGTLTPVKADVEGNSPPQTPCNVRTPSWPSTPEFQPMPQPMQCTQQWAHSVPQWPFTPQPTHSAHQWAHSAPPWSWSYTTSSWTLSEGAAQWSAPMHSQSSEPSQSLGASQQSTTKSASTMVWREASRRSKAGWREVFDAGGGRGKPPGSGKTGRNKKRAEKKKKKKDEEESD